MSGFAEGHHNGSSYRITISGGPSSWDYESIRKQSKELSNWAKNADPEISLFIKNAIIDLLLPISKYDPEGLDCCYGGIIEEKNNKNYELDNKANFMKCLKMNKQHKAIIATNSFMIKDSYYNASVAFIVTERIHQDDIKTT